jgi:hypothetical protein
MKCLNYCIFSIIQFWIFLFLACFLSQSDAIMKQKCYHENASNLWSSHLDNYKRARISFVSNISLDFEAGLVSDNNEEENLEYLWYDTCHCQKTSFLSSVSHQAVTVSTLLILQTSILTGHNEPLSTPWLKWSRSGFIIKWI